MFHYIKIAIVAFFAAGAITVFADDSTPSEGAFSPKDYEFFERKIRPLLSEHCYSCHSSKAKTVHGGLRLDSFQGLHAGGDIGPVISQDKPTESSLLSAVKYDGDIQMPPKGKLSEVDLALLTKWVEMGAPFPKSNDAEFANREIDFEEGRKFWSFQPVQSERLPTVVSKKWPQNRIDYFVLAKMESNRLSPAAEADRRVLIRRLYFTLTGLPPSPEAVEAFAADKSVDAYERLVDSLLTSPQYGEKWAREWLDLARYTDRTASWLYKNGEPFRYRDWVIAAMNEDIPYDDFVKRQLATDLMADTGPKDMAALGFLGLSPAYWKELKLPCEIIKVIAADEWEERVDAISRTYLGLTVACARCHDHKFDPISSSDYYAMAGVVASCRLKERPMVDETEYQAVIAANKEVEALTKKIAALKKAKPKQDAPDPAVEISALQQKIKTLQSTPHFSAPVASAVAEESAWFVRAGKLPENGTRIDYRPEPRDLPLFIRGNPNRPGPIVKRGFLTVLSSEPKTFENGSGRLELAEAITTDAASLAARVIVNRVWLSHFGRGIVNTPSNFGKQGDRPSHPELLNDVTARFIANGWSLKSLHREIVLSATWRQASQNEKATALQDPENTWLSRMNRRRLPFESWRDAMLAATSDLDYAKGGQSFDLANQMHQRRTIYATIHRRDMSTTLQNHDFPDPTAHSPKREQTITALQGLHALNGPLFTSRSAALADLLARSAEQDAQKLTLAYRLLFQRTPTTHEREIATAFLSNQANDNQANAWRQLCHALLASNEFLFID